MKNIEHLDDIEKDDLPHFENKIEGLIKDAEEMRLDYMKRYRTRQFIAMNAGLLAVLAGGGGFGWFLLMETNLVKAIACIAIAIALPTILHIWAEGPKSAYKKAHKSQFMPHMAKLLGGFKFFPQRGVSAKILRKTGLFPNFDRYLSEDCFMGKYKGARVIFSEARLFSKAHKHHPVFSGLMIYFETPKSIAKGHTIITADQDRIQKYAKTLWKKLKPVDLSADKGNTGGIFNVFSNHPKTAKNLAHPGFMKELSEAAEIFDRAALSAVIFDKRRVFIAIPHEEDMFEASNIYAPVLTREHARRLQKEIQQIIEIIDIFDLYTAQST